jgi:hypothetical protein
MSVCKAREVGLEAIAGLEASVVVLWYTRDTSPCIRRSAFARGRNGVERDAYANMI